MPKKVSQSGFGPVIVCHFALSSIWGLPKHPRITKNHPIFGEFHQEFGESHQNFGEFHPDLIGVHQVVGVLECLFTSVGVLLGCQKRCPKVVSAQ